MRHILLLVSALFLIAGCQKKDPTDPATASVDIEINTPVEGQSFHSGDTVYMKGMMSYASELHGYEVKIVDTATGFIVYDDAQHIHTDKFTIDDTWATTVNHATGYRVSFIAYKDHDGNQVTKDINIQIAP